MTTKKVNGTRISVSFNADKAKHYNEKDTQKTRQKNSKFHN